MGKDVKKDLTTRDLGRALGKKIARLERHVRELEVASQGAFRSVEDGAIDWYDDDGVLRDRIGKQKDGSYGRKAFTGDIPPAPSEPDVVVISDGVVAITWDGRWEERYSHVGWRNVQIHMSDDLADMPGDRDTQVGAIFASRGGTVVAVTESDDDNPVYVWLVGTNDAGQAGDPSVAVLVDELDDDDLEEGQEEFEWENRDGHTLTTADVAAGTVTFGLSHIPEEKSLLAWWHSGGLAYAGVPQDADQYTVNYEAPSVTWPLTGNEEVGDRLRVYYPYLIDGGLVVEWGSAGWRYLAVPLADSTNRAGVGFDDSAWSISSAPFGNGLSGPPWPTPATSFSAQTKIWARKSIDIPIGVSEVEVSYRVDNKLRIYLDGTLVFGPAGVDGAPVESFNAGTFAVTPGGTHLLAVLFEDDVTPTGDGTYGDIRLT